MEKKLIDDIYNSSEFQEIIQKKKRWQLIISGLFLSIFLFLPILLLMEVSISIVWGYLLLLFPLTWFIGWLYSRLMNVSDNKLNQ